VGTTLDYGRLGPEAFLNTRNDGEDQLGHNKRKRRADGAVGDLDPEFDALTAALRQMHDSIADEPVPDDFLALLDKIEAKFSASQKLS
jgi:hypothetical protein